MILALAAISKQHQQVNYRSNNPLFMDTQSVQLRNKVIIRFIAGIIGIAG
jgi:hypothetical protein